MGEVDGGGPLQAGMGRTWHSLGWQEEAWEKGKTYTLDKAAFWQRKKGEVRGVERGCGNASRDERKRPYKRYKRVISLCRVGVRG